MNNIDRTSVTLTEDYRNVTVLNQMIKCRDGILSVSDDSFSKDDIHN